MEENLYAENIIMLYENPHNKKVIQNADTMFHATNPICGDDIRIYLKIKNGKIEDVGFDGEGCAISTASASLITDSIKGKSITEVEKMGAKDVIRLLHVDPGPARIKCAMLPMKAVLSALFLYDQKQKK
ncbi:MAG: SUF system NifU family Fe-S cluster assembly protein [Candidatus Micrarchaeaceae archaeon]